MKKFNKKSLALLIAAALLLTITVSGTVAYLVDSTGSLVNTFTPTVVDTEITEKFDGSSKSSIVITNVGERNIDVYVRVAVVGNWVLNNQIVDSWTLSDEYINKSNWNIGSDGFYYYNTVLEAGSTTANLLSKAIISPLRTDGAHLEVTVMQQAIQADGMGATSAQDAFSKAAQSN